MFSDKIINKIRIMKKFVTQFDLFSSAPILRAEGESAVMNLCGGLFSILVFGFFTYIFFSSIVSTVNLQNISATQTTQTSNVDNKTIGNIVIGIGLQWMSLVNHQHIFQLRAFLVDKSTNMKEIRVFPCTRDFWNKIDDTKFTNLGLDQYMCIQEQPIQLYGENGSPQLQSLYIKLSQCNPLTSPVTCANSTAMTDFLTNQKIWGNRFFACSLAILDVGLNPTDQNSITYTIYEKTQWLLFNLEQQIMVQMFLGTFTVNTDTNFMPVVSNQQQKGYFVSEAISNTLINTQSLPIFVQCFIFTSPINLIINQTFGKFDQVLSYVGGLYGIVISFLAYFLLSFNQYRYELRVSEGAFSYKERYLVRQSDLHFGKYIKYVIYDWIKSLFCYQINWKDCRAINEARSEAIEQIDVKHLLQRISHLQKMNRFFVNKEIETALYLAEANSLQDVKKRRNIVEYCQKFTDVEKSITISIFQQSHALFEFITNANALNPQINKSDSNKTSELIQCAQNDEQLVPSLYLMKQYCLKYAKKFNITKDSFTLDEDDIKVQQEIAEAFFALSQEIRMKLIRKIPLGILYRINQYDGKKKDQSNGLERYQNKIQKTEENLMSSARKKPKNNKILNSFDSNFKFEFTQPKQ